MAADDTTLSTADNSDPFIPKYTDGTPIQWDGNYAHIDGALYETGRYYKRTGLFQLFFKHRAVALSNGRIAVESFNAVWFTSGRVADRLTSGKTSHDFDDPCPPTAERYANATAAYTARGAAPPPNLTRMPPAYAPYTVQSQAHDDKEDSTLLKSLTYAFGSAECSSTTRTAAAWRSSRCFGSSPPRLLATPTDRALVSAEHAKVVRHGVPGELTLDTLKKFEEK